MLVVEWVGCLETMMVGLLAAGALELLSADQWVEVGAEMMSDDKKDAAALAVLYR